MLVRAHRHAVMYPHSGVNTTNPYRRATSCTESRLCCMSGLTTACVDRVFIPGCCQVQRFTVHASGLVGGGGLF